MTTRVMRTIDKCGGLDEYLLGEKPARIKELGMLGWSLRWKVMRTEWYDNKMREKIAKMNLPPKVSNHLLVGLDQLRGKTEKIVTAQHLDEQLEESDKNDLGEEALVMADETELGPNEFEIAAKEEPEKETEKERILFMVEQSPSSLPRASA